MMIKLQSPVIRLLMTMIFSLSLFACGNGDKGNSTTSKKDSVKTTESTHTAEPAKVATVTEEKQPKTSEPITNTKKLASTNKPASETKAEHQQPMVNQQAMLNLARKSGCLACHDIDKKIVGPAWNDVAARYKNIKDARSLLTERISKGGRGNWSDVVGNVAMPPYYPRVSKENIAQLVDFILSLK